MTDSCSVGCGPNPCGTVQIIQGYARTFYVDLFYTDTNNPYDLGGVVQIKAVFPGPLPTQPVIETYSLVLITIGTVVLGSNQLTGLAMTAGIVDGLPIVGSGVPPGTYVASITGGVVTMTQNATGTFANTSMTFGNTTVTLIGNAGAGRMQVMVPALDSAQLQIDPNGMQPQDLQISVTNSDGSITAFVLPAVLNIVPSPYGVV